MNKIKISVIIPIYNREKYITQCIKSIMKQSFKNIEIICVNDGSTDSSLKILEELQKKDKRIVIIDKKNSGVCSARNIGLEKAKGNYILFVDGDDWIEPTCIEECYNKVTKFNLDMVSFGFIKKYTDNSKNEITMDLVEFKENDIISGKEYFKNLLNFKASVVVWNKLLKKEIILKNNIKFLEKITVTEDVLFLANLTKYLNKIGKIDKVFYNYRMGENNGTGNIKEKYMEDASIVFSEINKLYLTEKEIIPLINKRKIINFSWIVLNKKYHKFRSYKQYENEFFKTLKKVKFSRKDEINISKRKKELFIIFKIFPFHLTILAYMFLRDFKHRNKQ